MVGICEFLDPDIQPTYPLQHQYRNPFVNPAKTGETYQNIFFQVVAKFRLDNTIFIQYLNSNCIKPVDFVIAPETVQYIVAHPQWTYNHSFLLDLF